jgi:hypothetical protein
MRRLYRQMLRFEEPARDQKITQHFFIKRAHLLGRVPR